MSKKTDELDFELKNSYDVHTYMADNEVEFDDNKFLGFLYGLITKSGKTKTQIATDSCISEPYLYNILRADKHPSRKSVIKLSFGLGLDVETTERLLMLAGYSGFYVRHKRDALLQFACQNNMNTMEADNLLSQYGLSLAGE
jgi:DNA-binding phage protein